MIVGIMKGARSVPDAEGAERGCGEGHYDEGHISLPAFAPAQ